jgi:hypothetical protein
MLLGVLPPSLAAGQVPPGSGTPPADFYVTPSLSVGEVYDDNLFFSATNRQSDFFTRVSPGIVAGYQSTPFTVLGGYTFDSEFYNEHQELSTFQMRQRASLDIKSRPTESLTLSAAGGYFKTRTPFELNTLTGVAVRRVRADRLSFEPSATYRFDPYTSVTADYLYSKDRMDGAVTIDSHIGRFDLDRRIASSDTLGAGYIGRRFEFGGVGSITSHAATLGWKHDFTPQTKLTIRAGPRFTEGSLDRQPEALASIQHRVEHGELSLTYSNTQTTVIGQSGAAIAESFGLAVLYRLSQSVHVSAAPTVFRIEADRFNTTVYLLDLGTTYQWTKSLALKGSYQFSLMRGSFNPITGPGGDVDVLHNVFWLRLVLTYPSRLE